MAGRGYIPSMIWDRTVIGGETGKNDFVASVGGITAGRIMRRNWEPLEGKWSWAGACPPNFQGRPSSPNSGYEDTPREAARMCEEYWVRNGGLLPRRKRDSAAGIGQKAGNDRREK